MITYTRERIRLEVDAVKQEPMLDVITGASPSAWRGTDLAIEFGIFYGGVMVDITPFSSITCEIRDQSARTSVVLATRTIAAAQLNPSLTNDQWEAGTHQHGVFTWTSAESNWDLQGTNERIFWLVIHAITTDSPPRRVTLGATLLKIVEDGVGESSASPVPGDPLYLTAEQTQALIGQVIRPGNNPAGTTITLVSPNGQWGRIIGVDDQGAPTDDIISLA